MYLVMSGYVFGCLKDVLGYLCGEWSEDVWAALDCLGGIRGLSPCRFKSGWSLQTMASQLFPLFFLRHQNIRASPCHLSKNEVLSGINHLQPSFFYFTHEWSLVVEQATGTPFGRFLVRSEVLPLVSLCNWKSGWWARRQEGKLKIPATST